MGARIAGRQHEMHDCGKRVQVGTRLGLPFVLLGCSVALRSCRGALFVLEMPCESEVNQLDEYASLTRLGKHYVFGLEVTVNNRWIVTMQILECIEDL
jgi:hypothetical protein